MIKAFNEYIKEGLNKIPDKNKNGDCYIQAYNYFMNNHTKNKNLRLCHGLVTGQGKIKGIVYNHAWCEDINKGVVFDMTMPSFFQNVETKIYYLMGKINTDTVFKYDFNEVIDKASEFKTYGPWEEVLINNEY